LIKDVTTHIPTLQSPSTTTPNFSEGPKGIVTDNTRKIRIKIDYSDSDKFVAQNP